MLRQLQRVVKLLSSSGPGRHRLLSETPAQAAQPVGDFQMQGIDATCYTKNQAKNGRGILIVFSCLRVSTMHILLYLMTARLKRAQVNLD